MGTRTRNWTLEIRQGSEVDLTKLKKNQRAAYGTGRDDHSVYTHACSKKRRSDAGVPRKRKAEPPAQVAGALSFEQVARIRDLNDTVETWLQAEHQASLSLKKTTASLQKCETERDDYLDSLTAQ